MAHCITVMPQQRQIEATPGENLLQVLRTAGIWVDAVCGGNGSCGNCKVLVDGVEVLACHTVVDRDMTVAIPISQTRTAVISQTATTNSAEFSLARPITHERRSHAYTPETSRFSPSPITTIANPQASDNSLTVNLFFS